MTIYCTSIMIMHQTSNIRVCYTLEYVTILQIMKHIQGEHKKFPANIPRDFCWCFGNACGLCM